MVFPFRLKTKNPTSKQNNDNNQDKTTLVCGRQGDYGTEGLTLTHFSDSKTRIITRVNEYPKWIRGKEWLPKCWSPTPAPLLPVGTRTCHLILLALAIPTTPEAQRCSWISADFKNKGVEKMWGLGYKRFFFSYVSFHVKNVGKT